MSNGRQGAWPPQSLSGNSTHSSPSSSSNAHYNGAGGDYNQNPNASFQSMPQPNTAAAAAAAAATAAARYNASMMTPTGYAPQGQSGPPMPQQQQQQQPPYGAQASGSGFYASSPYGQPTAQPGQQHPRGIPSPTAPQQTPSVHNQAVFHPSVHPYAGYAGPPMGASGALPQQHAMGPSSDMTYAGAWVSAVPSSYTPQDGSAISKSVHYQARDGSAKSKVEAHMQPPNSQMSGLPYQPQQHLQQQHYMGNHAIAVKQERNFEHDEDGEDNDDADGESGSKKKAQKGASDFVKKLFRMLDDTTYASIVTWSATGDSFVVRDMNDFTKHILPRQFRHSNFASFVRQLNKYDFHKVKMTDESGQPQHLGVEQQWEFRHPAFMQGREDLLEHVRRKAPLGKKPTRGKDDDGSPRDGSPNMPGVADAAEKGAQEYSQLKEQVAHLTASQDHMTNHINSLTKQYQAVIGEMLTFQKNMVQQDQLMQNLIQYLMNLEADRKIEGAESASTQQAIQGAPPTASSRPQLENSGAFVSSADAEKLVHNFRDVARASFSQMSQLSQRAASQNGGNAAVNTPSTHSVGGASSSTQSQHRVSAANDEGLSPKSSHATPATMVGQSPLTNGGMKGKEREASTGASQQAPMYFHPPHLEDENPSNDLFSAAANAVDNPSLAGFEGAGLRVFTVGTLQPRSEYSDATEPAALHAALSNDASDAKAAEQAHQAYGISVPNLENLPAGMPRVDGRATSNDPTPKPGGAEGSNPPGTPSEAGGNMLRVRRSTYVPGWAVPPKVLVVDDDDVCRKLGSKFLQVFGCAIDVAVDGVTAVNKMNLEKYDLVLMDIVMPNLDGVSATSLIREFDARTPIISMTSNSGPQELLSYMSSGMNDVLPKPFTKEGLLNMLEKHLIHLKTVQKMDEIPKALGLPPISEGVMQDILSATAASAQTMGGSHGSAPGDGANPMAAMMGNGPDIMRASVDAGGSRDHASTTASGAVFGVDDEGGLVNPLAGMGFSDEEYISMLQNLIAAGSVSDGARGEAADTVADVMGVARGEGATAAMAGARSKESTPFGGSQRGSMLPPQGITRKRSSEADGTESLEAKKSRFTELST